MMYATVTVREEHGLPDLPRLRRVEVGAVHACLVSADQTFSLLDRVVSLRPNFAPKHYMKKHRGFCYEWI